MNLSIGTSLAAYAVALEHEASSLVLYNGHAGLGANAAGSLPGASADDEVQFAFEHGQLHGPVVVAPLWNEKAKPPTDNATASKHSHLHAALPSHEQMHPASAVDKSGSSMACCVRGTGVLDVLAKPLLARDVALARAAALGR